MYYIFLHACSYIIFQNQLAKNCICPTVYSHNLHRKLISNNSVLGSCILGLYIPFFFFLVCVFCINHACFVFVCFYDSTRVLIFSPTLISVNNVIRTIIEKTLNMQIPWVVLGFKSLENKNSS